jgi:Protein of unknown function (DUF2946)
MHWFRVSKRLPSLALLLAFIAPVLLGIMPTPALSVEQQLMADLSGNICSQIAPRGQSGDKNLPTDHHSQCCILCAGQTYSFVVADTPAIVSIELERSQQPQQAIEAKFIPRGFPSLDSASPRGPPTLLSI